MERNPPLALVANNLAYLLATNNDSYRETALELMNYLVKRWPKEPHFRDTRGQILRRLERWQETITDLESAEPFLKSNQELRQSLSDAYWQLGRVEAAYVQAELAAGLRAGLIRSSR